jgi:hypothetical protein
MRAGARWLSVSLLAALLLGIAVASAWSAATPNAGIARTSSAAAFSQPPSPVLIDQAMRSGTLDTATGTLYLAYALAAPDRLPVAYQSDTPFHGTVWLLQVHETLPTLAAGPAKAEIETLLGPAGGNTFCSSANEPSPDRLQTAHFILDYDKDEVNGGPDGLTIQDYADSLETSWTTEINDFGWARVPKHPNNPLPKRKYLVKITDLGAGLYGFVSTIGTGAGQVGDNKNTEWNDLDAAASCMGLNSDYSAFPGTPQRALDATTAHEFNHSIQFGYGGLAGANRPDSAFVEGGATWMEDEVFDNSNDNYNYLWPTFADDMGSYTGSPYPYWVTFRGLTERYGASVPDGGENVMQTFWELTSKNEASNLEALALALQDEGTTLKAAYHAYGIAVKFNRNCGGGYVYPHCFEEGRQYVEGDGTQDGAGETVVHGTIGSVGQSFNGQVPDNYALHWVSLPKRSQEYRATLRNTSEGGSFLVSVACDTGSQVRVTEFPREIGQGEKAAVRVRQSNQCNQIVAVITNVDQTEANPPSSQNRSYRLSTS